MGTGQRVGLGREGKRCWGDDACIRVAVSICRCHIARVPGFSIVSCRCSIPLVAALFISSVVFSTLLHTSPLSPLQCCPVCRFQYEQEVQRNPLRYCCFDLVDCPCLPPLSTTLSVLCAGSSMSRRCSRTLSTMTPGLTTSSWKRAQATWSARGRCAAGWWSMGGKGGRARRGEYHLPAWYRHLVLHLRQPSNMPPQVCRWASVQELLWIHGQPRLALTYLSPPPAKVYERAMAHLPPSQAQLALAPLTALTFLSCISASPAQMYERAVANLPPSQAQLPLTPLTALTFLSCFCRISSFAASTQICGTANSASSRSGSWHSSTG